MAVLSGAITLLGVVICYGLSEAAVGKAPETALRFNPWQSKALGQVAFQRLQEGGRANIASAEALARRAVILDPTAVAAVRTLGYAAGIRGEMARAERMIDQSQALSRRDAGTQMWLIEREVSKNNVEGALRHYDIALKTAPSVRGALLPIMVAATSDPALLVPMAKLIAERPVWRADFVRLLLTDAPDAMNAAAISDMLDRRGAPLEQVEKVTLSNRLIGEKKYAAAARLMHRGRQSSLVFDERFQGKDDGNPFGWRFRNEPDLGADINPEAGGSSLRVYANNGRGGDVAQQLLLLPSGRYTLTTVLDGARPSRGGAPYWTLTCANGPEIASISLPIPTSGDGYRTPLAVPADCAAQWMVLHLRSEPGYDVNLTVRRASIAPEN